MAAPIALRRWSASLVAIAALAPASPVAFADPPVWGQVYGELGSYMVADAWASCTCPPGGGGSVPSLPVADTYGEGGLADQFWTAFQWAQVGAPPCWCRSIGDALIRVDGVGTTTLRIRFDAVANANHDCVDQCRQGQCNCPSTYETGAYAIIDYGLLPNIVVDEVTLVRVNYRWSQMSANMYRPEAPGGGDDISDVTGTMADIDVTGTPDGDMGLGGGEFDLPAQRGSHRDGGTGTFVVSVGPNINASFLISYTVGLIVQIKQGARGQQHPCLEYDSESVASGLELVLTLSEEGGGGGGIPPPEGCPTPELRFSLRTGSDYELSDPTPDGNEGADPGDAYVAASFPTPPGGADGVADDAPLFGGDPPPDPPAGGSAPTCSGIPVEFARTPYFERDGMDQIGTSLVALMASQPQQVSGALLFPIPRDAVPADCCIPEARYLSLSFADKSSGPFVSCDVPVTTASPLGATYGSPPDRDEVVGAMVVPGIVGTGIPLAASTYSLHDEDELGLVPSPPPTPPMAPPPPQDMDDDVNALSAVPMGGGSCIIELVSASHEACGPPDPSIPSVPPTPLLDPGSVYEYDPSFGALMLAVDEVVHLGLSDTTDLDAIEVAWLDHAVYGASLALLFSVDDDDPATAGDESGGLDPSVIYYSFLDGSFGVYVEGLHDNVDAITAYDEPLLPPDAQVPQCATCPGDLTGDAVVDSRDLPPFVACLLAPGCDEPCAELNGSPGIDSGDASAFATKLLGTTDGDVACP